MKVRKSCYPFNFNWAFHYYLIIHFFVECARRPRGRWDWFKYIKKYYFFIIILSGVRLGPLGTAATSGLLYQPQMIGEGDCGAIGGMKIGRRNRSTRRKSALAPLCPPKNPHYQTRARTWTTAVESQRLTAWSMALSYQSVRLREYELDPFDSE
jgi:hypothetical protein